MTARELIEKLQRVNPNARVHTGYDGNVVVELAGEVEEILNEDQIGNCWFSVHVGDVVILAA
jgi:hypothetical protein